MFEGVSKKELVEMVIDLIKAKKEVLKSGQAIARHEIHRAEAAENQVMDLQLALDRSQIELGILKEERRALKEIYPDLELDLLRAKLSTPTNKKEESNG